MTEFQVKVATLNVRQAGVAKTPAIHHLARDMDIVALQEMNVNAESLPGLVEQWRTLGYEYISGEANPQGLHRVALISRLPTRWLPLQIDVEEDRVCAMLCEVKLRHSYFKFCVACCYGPVADVPRAREMATQVATAMSQFALPWIALGDWNLTSDEMASIFSTGMARCFDTEFEVEARLPPTCSGTRRIDFAMGHGIWPSATFQCAGLADHNLVGYDLDMCYSAHGLCVRPRCPIKDDSEQDILAKFHSTWVPQHFHEMLRRTQLDQAWELLSDTAERCLCAGTLGINPRSRPPVFHMKNLGHKVTLEPESAKLRRLRRLVRRLQHFHKEQGHNPRLRRMITSAQATTN